MTFCEECGNKLENDSVFCDNCGTNVKQIKIQPMQIRNSNNTSNNQEKIESKSLWNGYILFWKNYAVFNGRTNRKDYWGFLIFHSLMCFAVFYLPKILSILIGLFLGHITGLSMGGKSDIFNPYDIGLGIGLLSGVITGWIFSYATLFAYCMITFIPLMAITTRRLHDTNKSGWLQLLSFIPIIGNIPLIYWLGFEKGDEEENKYGINPKYIK